VIRRLFRLAGLLAFAAAIVWLTREHLLPTPQVTHEPPPHYRSTPPPPAAVPDDLTAIKGIGPVFAARLAEIGITSFHTLADADPRTIASATKASPAAIDEWIAQANGRIT
jgi:predicted flap endonuclease-1-like 5' DNA nuclease